MKPEDDQHPLEPLIINHLKEAPDSASGANASHANNDDHVHVTVENNQLSLRQAPRRILFKTLSLMRPGHASRIGKRIAYCFVPQLLRSNIWDDAAPKPKHFSTSYLNGLRGITSVKVFTFHYTFAFSDFGFQPWGTDDRHRYFLELPIIRYFYAGFTAHIFFGLAGYLTTLRLFQLIDKHDQASRSQVLVNVSGALFRRAFRLYLPTLIVTLITAHYIYFGLYESNRPFLLDHAKLFPGEWNEPKPEQFATYYGQLHNWAREMFDLTNIFAPGAVYPYHDQHLWSILAEMKGSLFLYVVVIATAQCHRQIRLISLCVMTVMFFLWNHWEIWVYLLGAIVAQIDLFLTEREQDRKMTLTPDRLPPSPPRSPAPEEKRAETWDGSDSSSSPRRFFRSLASISIFRNFHSILRAFGFIVAFYLLSYPIDGSRDYAPGYMTLNRLIPEWMDRKDKFYPNFGTALLLLLLARSDPVKSTWRRILNSDIPQYLGRISFALYLVHGPLLHAVGYMIPHRIWWSMGTEGVDTTNGPWIFAILVGWSISLAVSLWAADVWTREVESRCVKAVKKLEELCFVKK
ncbi:hypothetical protein A1O3_02115 [Capronia epimyces CBS 606.96]|uniref:Acyltransferase 3 domain-containing protein n=1 Tax=Capronia epimyces CBS 606.96 TaxID=1182542 RepID=W9YIH0_9EURO|nr:uncharacterized protein A1O3_02115 [Capronia epimyces CBS 606.96]EXJ89051.1 hypothetical protein A1O3_02115 [Capronia epimyces CBS 606.96]